MQAAVLRKFHSELSIEDIEPPEGNEGEEVIKVISSGLCRTDLHLIDGLYTDLNLPIVLGHEVSGLSESLGPVIVYGSKGCGTCYYCKRGDFQLCESSSDIGINKNGGFAEYILAPRMNLIPIGEIGPVRASVLADAGVTAYRAVRKLWQFLEQDDDVLIIGGTGGVAMFVIQFLKLFHKVNVTTLSRNKEKFEMAYKYGADLAVGYDQKLGEYKAIVDLVGSTETIALGNRHLLKSGILLIVGEEGGSFNVNYRDVHHGEQVYAASLWGSLKDLKEVVEIAKQKQLSWDIKKFKLTSINSAIRELREGMIEGRAVIEP